MARIEPGLYEPSDDVRVFDGAEDDYDDEGSRLPLLIVIALLVLAAFAGVVWLAYTQGVQRGRQDVPRVIAADSGPVKTAPDQPGGAANPYKGLKIYNNKAPADAHAGSQPLPSIITQPGEPLFSAFGPKHPAPVPAAAPAPAKPAPAPVQQRVAVQAPPPAVVHPAPAPVAVAPKPAPVAAKPAPVVTKPAPAPVTVAKVTPPPAAPVTAPAVSGAYVAQIAAFKSQAEAETGWAAFKRNHAAILGGMSPSIVSVDLGEKGTWFRLRTGSFADKAAAAAFCDKLKAEGASCLPAKG
jgi:cell division protein FtsN